MNAPMLGAFRYLSIIEDLQMTADEFSRAMSYVHTSYSPEETRRFWHQTRLDAYCVFARGSHTGGLTNAHPETGQESAETVSKS